MKANGINFGKLLMLSCVLAGLLTACNSQPDVARLLRHADSMLTDQPDSALCLLNDILDESSFTPPEQMQLIWDKAMAHYRLDMSLAEDSLIGKAAAYYRQSGDSSKLYDGYLLEGMYLRWANRDNEAIAVFDEGINLAIARQDTADMLVLQRKKLEVYYKQSRYKECRKMIEDMLRIADKLPVEEHYQMVYSLALVSQLDGDLSNMDCLEKAANLAFAAGDTTFAYHIQRNHGDAFMLAGRYRDAIEQFHQLMKAKFSFTTSFINAIKLSMAYSYFCLEQFDSARYYVNQVEQSLDDMRKRNKNQTQLIEKGRVYLLRAVLDNRVGNPIDIVGFERYCDSIEVSLAEKHQTELRQQETRTRLQQQNYELTIRRQRLEFQIVLIIALLLGMVLILRIMYQRNLKRKEQVIRQLSDDLQKHLRQLKDNERLITQNQESIRELQMQLVHQQAHEQQEQQTFIENLKLQNQELTQLNQDLQRQIDIYWKQLNDMPSKDKFTQKLTAEVLQLKDRELLLTTQLITSTPLVKELRTSPRFLQSEDFNHLTTLVNKVYPDFTLRLMKQYPRLTDVDLQLCILLKLNFSIAQIAAFTAVSPTSVSQQKSRTKKRILQQTPDTFADGETLDSWLYRF